MSNPTLTLALLGKDGQILDWRSSRCSLIKEVYRNNSGHIQRIHLAILSPPEQSLSNLALKLAIIRNIAKDRGTAAVALRYHTGGGAGAGSAAPGLMSVSAVDPNTEYGSYFTSEYFANSGPQCIDYGIDKNGDWARTKELQCHRQPVLSAPDRTIVAMPSTNSKGFQLRPFIGDSAAGPAAAGVAALLLSARVPPNKIEKLLENSAAQQGTEKWSTRYGYGVINADAAAALVGIIKPSRSKHFAHRLPCKPFHPTAAFRLIRKLALAATRGNIQALLELKSDADDHNLNAETWLSVYDRKMGYAKDSFRLMWDAAQQGAPVAQSFLGSYFNRGWGTRKDFHSAYVWWLRAAHAGVTNAIYNLGIAVAGGRGTTANPELGFVLLETVHKRGLFIASLNKMITRVKSLLTESEVHHGLHMATHFAHNPSSIPTG